METEFRVVMASVRTNPEANKSEKNEKFRSGPHDKRTICPIRRNFESVLPLNKGIFLNTIRTVQCSSRRAKNQFRSNVYSIFEKCL